MSKRVCVLMGGESDERNISLRSGRAVLDALKRQGLEAIGIDACNGFKQRLEKIKPDVVFVALHGRGGEDGTVQRVLERLKLSYVGSAPTGSSNAFDKWRAKKLFLKAGIPTPLARLLNSKNWRKEWLRVPLPAVIKPTQNGSSIGIAIVETPVELQKSLRLNIERYGPVLAERKIEGREFTVGIVDGRALPVIELKPKRTFYDYKAKYTKGMTDYLVPAPIDESCASTLRELAERVYKVLGLRHFCRVDFMSDHAGNPYVLEANTIPGFTSTSLLPKAAAISGLDFDHLCLKLIELAEGGTQSRS